MGRYDHFNHVYCLLCCCLILARMAAFDFFTLCCAASGVPLLAYTHGSFSRSMLDFFEQRFRNVRSPTAAVEKCAVTTGIVVLLKATGHGTDPLADVLDLDIFDWDPGRLRCTLSKTQKNLADKAFKLRLLSCKDPLEQQACLNREVKNDWVGIAVKKNWKKGRKFDTVTPPNVDQVPVAPSLAEAEEAFALGMSMGSDPGGGFFFEGVEKRASPVMEGMVAVAALEAGDLRDAEPYGFYPDSFAYLPARGQASGLAMVGDEGDFFSGVRWDDDAKSVCGGGGGVGLNGDDDGALTLGGGSGVTRPIQLDDDEASKRWVVDRRVELGGVGARTQVEERGGDAEQPVRVCCLYARLQMRIGARAWLFTCASQLSFRGPSFPQCALFCLSTFALFVFAHLQKAGSTAARTDQDAEFSAVLLESETAEANRVAEDDDAEVLVAAFCAALRADVPSFTRPLFNPAHDGDCLVNCAVEHDFGSGDDGPEAAPPLAVCTHGSGADNNSIGGGGEEQGDGDWVTAASVLPPAAPPAAPVVFPVAPAVTADALRLTVVARVRSTQLAALSDQRAALEAALLRGSSPAGSGPGSGLEELASPEARAAAEAELLRLGGAAVAAVDAACKVMARPGVVMGEDELQALAEGGLAYLEEHLNAYCDDAKQNNFHTKSVLDATIDVFLKARPWLGGARKGRVQSDGAGNYRDPTTEMDLNSVGTRCFSEAGMGKDEGDANDAVIKGMMKRARDAGSGIESAGDIRAMTSTFGISGQTHAKLKVNRSAEDSGIVGRDSVCRNYGMWTLDGKSITFWESLDLKASKETMKRTGRAVGYGPGVKMSFKEFNETQRTQLTATGAALEMQDGTSSAVPNPRQRASHEEKSRAKGAAEAKRVGVKEAAVEKAAVEVAKIEGAFAGDVDECARCGLRFLTAGWYNRHLARWCPSRKATEERRRSQRHVQTMLATADGLAVEQRIERVKALCEVKVKLDAPERGGAKALGISMVQDAAGCFVVTAVCGLAEASAQIADGYVVSDIDGAPPTDKDELLKELKAGTWITVTFRRPAPEIPFHGSARKGIHKQARFKMLSEQEGWLQEYVFKNGIPLLRAAAAWTAMKAKFSGKIRNDTLTPGWLDKDQIATWLAAQVKKEKDLRRDKKRKQEADAAAWESEAEQERPKKKAKVRAATATKMETPATKANAPGAKKAKPSKNKVTGAATSAKSKKKQGGGEDKKAAIAVVTPKPKKQKR